MSEMAKTVTFLASALLVSVLALVTRSGPVGDKPPDQTGKPLFARFADPYEATSMRIVRFDEGLGQISNFQVTQKEGQWVIPSHEDYPADAQEQLKNAATALVDLNVIQVVSDAAGAHAMYGVLEPDKDKTELGQKGVGMLVSLRDAKDNELANLIIGQPVKGTEDQRFVRVPGRNQVYTVKIDPNKFSIKFEDWIEKDLLDLSSFDIKQLILKDYSVDTAPTLDGRLAVTNYEQRLELGVSWNADDYKWELAQLKELKEDKLEPSQLAPDEELNKQALDGLKDAVDELKIVDVERKPAGMGADLKADKGFLNDNEGVRSLLERGFYPVSLEPNHVDLLSSDGEVLVRTKDGVEYVLRFGQIAGVATSSAEEQGKLNRYVFVTARVHEEDFPYPELESLPQEKGEPQQPAPLGQQDQPAGSNAPDDSAGQGQSAAAAPQTPTEVSSAQAAPPSADTPEKSGQNAEQGADKKKDDVQDERERIVKENERKLNEYKEKRKKAEDKVKELNFRFADWYYVISEDVYKKIHLGRADVVKKKDAEDKKDDKDGSADQGADAGFDVDTFRKLQEEGLKTDAGPQNDNP
jgi:hypothetical protein